MPQDICVNVTLHPNRVDKYGREYSENKLAKRYFVHANTGELWAYFGWIGVRPATYNEEVTYMKNERLERERKATWASTNEEKEMLRAVTRDAITRLEQDIDGLCDEMDRLYDKLKSI